MNIKTAVVSIMALCVLASPTASQAQEGSRPNWTIDLAIYPYQRMVENDTDFTATINGNLPGRFSYFSFSNFKGVVTDGSAVFDRSEQNLRYAISERLPLDLALQVVLVHGEGNDFYQAGVSWRINDTPGIEKFFDKINLVWRMTVLPKRWGADNAAADARVMEHFFRLTVPKISKRLYLSGFYDKTFNEDVPGFMPSRPVVSEVQFGVRAWDNFYLVAEYRVNERRMGKNYNFAAGIEYKVRW